MDYIFLWATCTSLISISLAGWLYDGNLTSDDFISRRISDYLFPVLILLAVSIASFFLYHKKMTVLRLNGGKVLAYPISLSTILSATILSRHVNSSSSDIVFVMIGVVLAAGLFPGIAVGAIFCIIDLIRHPELKQYAN